MKINRDIRQIIIHCTATLPGQPVDVPTIDRWHKAQGMSCIGYHYLIGLDGSIMIGRPLYLQGAHCYGQNSDSIGIAYIGGLDADGKPADTRTDAQKRSLVRFIEFLRLIWPDITVHGHNEYSAKACPCFNVKSEYSFVFHT